MFEPVAATGSTGAISAAPAQRGQEREFQYRHHHTEQQNQQEQKSVALLQQLSDDEAMDTVSVKINNCRT